MYFLLHFISYSIKLNSEGKTKKKKLSRKSTFLLNVKTNYADNVLYLPTMLVVGIPCHSIHLYGLSKH